MDTTTLDTKLITLRAEDGALEQRLAELDTKLGLWLAAVEAGHATLRQLVRHVRPRVVPDDAQPAAVVAATPSPGSQEADAEAGSDEALLQRQEPAVAHAIRVKRRLSGGNRSVRELLEEYRASPTPEQPKVAERRGWWRRKNG